MKKFSMMILIISISFLFFLNFTILSAQKYPTQDANGNDVFDSDGIWHKNIELICPINFDRPYEGGSLTLADINGKLCYIAALNGLYPVPTDPLIRIDDLTDPRNPIRNALTIKLTKTDNNNLTTGIIVDYIATWKSKKFINNTKSTYAICVIGNARELEPTVSNHNVRNGIKINGVYAKAIIINLSKAMSFIKNKSSSTIIIPDINDRTSTHLDGDISDKNSDIYIGYIDANENFFNRGGIDPNNPPNKNYTKVHSINIEQQSSILTFSHLVTQKYIDILNPNGTPTNVEKTDGFVDVFLLDGKNYNNKNFFGIEDNNNYQGNNLLTLSRFEMQNTTNSNSTPIRYTADDEVPPAIPSGWPQTGGSHETRANLTYDMIDGKITSNITPDEIQLQIASFGIGNIFIGVNYSDPLNCIVNFDQFFNDESERGKPRELQSDFLNNTTIPSYWNWVGRHSVEGVTIDLNNHFFIATNEFPSQYVLIQNDNSFLPTTFSAANGSFKGLNNSNFNDENSKNEDDRRKGAYLKVWGSDRQHKLVRTQGTEGVDWEVKGPLSIYDVPEQTQTDRDNNLFMPVHDINDIAVTDCSSDGTGNNSRGPNSVHRVRTLFGTTGFLPLEKKNRSELYLSAYTQGVRVIDLKNFLKDDLKGNQPVSYEEDIIFESAYFDFYPTLNYDQFSRYFYAQAGAWNGTNGTNKYTNVQLPLANYYGGIWDVFPDIRMHGSENYNVKLDGDIPDDVNFLYAMGIAGTQSPFLKNSGYLILRYFRDEIGGTIFGNKPGNPALHEDMVFRNVNLQGDFKVQRDVIIASGCEVTLMPGKEGSKKTYRSTKFLKGTNGMKTVFVDGILNIGLDIVDDEGSEIIINVPVVVRDGGKLIINQIRSDFSRLVTFDKNVIVEAGGELIINEFAKATFNEDLYIQGCARLILENMANLEVKKLTTEIAASIIAKTNTTIYLNGPYHSLLGRSIFFTTPAEPANLFGNAIIDLCSNAFLSNPPYVILDPTLIENPSSTCDLSCPPDPSVWLSLSSSKGANCTNSGCFITHELNIDPSLNCNNFNFFKLKAFTGTEGGPDEVILYESTNFEPFNSNAKINNIDRCIDLGKNYTVRISLYTDITNAPCIVEQSVGCDCACPINVDDWFVVESEYGDGTNGCSVGDCKISHTFNRPTGFECLTDIVYSYRINGGAYIVGNKVDISSFSIPDICINAGELYEAKIELFRDNTTIPECTIIKQASCTCVCDPNKNDWLSLVSTKDETTGCGIGECFFSFNLNIPSQFDCFSHFKLSVDNGGSISEITTPTDIIDIFTTLDLYATCVAPNDNITVTISLMRGTNDPNPCVITQSSSCPLVCCDFISVEFVAADQTGTNCCWTPVITNSNSDPSCDSPTIKYYDSELLTNELIPNANNEICNSINVSDIFYTISFNGVVCDTRSQNKECDCSCPNKSKLESWVELKLDKDGSACTPEECEVSLILNIDPDHASCYDKYSMSYYYFNELTKTYISTDFLPKADIPADFDLANDNAFDLPDCISANKKLSVKIRLYRTGTDEYCEITSDLLFCPPTEIIPGSDMCNIDNDPTLWTEYPDFVQVTIGNCSYEVAFRYRKNSITGYQDIQLLAKYTDDPVNCDDSQRDVYQAALAGAIADIIADNSDYLPQMDGEPKCYDMWRGVINSCKAEYTAVSSEGLEYKVEIACTSDECCVRQLRVCWNNITEEFDVEDIGFVKGSSIANCSLLSVPFDPYAQNPTLIACKDIDCDIFKDLDISVKPHDPLRDLQIAIAGYSIGPKLSNYYKLKSKVKLLYNISNNNYNLTLTLLESDLDNITLNIVNLNGKTLISENIILSGSYQEFIIDLQELTTGNYFINIISNGKLFTTEKISIIR